MSRRCCVCASLFLLHPCAKTGAQWTERCQDSLCHSTHTKNGSSRAKIYFKSRDTPPKSAWQDSVVSIAQVLLKFLVANWKNGAEIEAEWQKCRYDFGIPEIFAILLQATSGHFENFCSFWLIVSTKLFQTEWKFEILGSRRGFWVIFAIGSVSQEGRLVRSSESS